MKNVTLRDRFLTWIAVIFLSLFFVFQIGVVYNLFEANMALLSKELNLITEDIYSENLIERLQDVYRDQDSISNNSFKEIFQLSDSYNKNSSIGGKQKHSRLSTIYLNIENYLNRLGKSIDIHQFRSELAEELKNNDIDLQFYVEIRDAKNDTILDTTLPPSIHPSSTLVSSDIPLGVNHQKFLRVSLINPLSDIYPHTFIMLILSFIFSLISLYCLYIQSKALSKQRLLANLKGDFFSEVSHELKQPLSTLKQAVSSLENEKIILDKEKRNKMLKIANLEIDRMNKKTEMLLSLAMDDEGTLEINKQKFDLVKMVYDLADEALNSTSKPIDINVDNELGSPYLIADQSHIEQVISNLIGNAIKYSKATIDINIRLFADDVYTCISIKDEGLGIKEEDLGLIFDKYKRVAKASNIKGHGIGLHYVKRIITKHQGTIIVTSHLNKGSEFTIKLPTFG